MTRKQYSKSDIKDLLKSYSYTQRFIDKKSNVAREDNLLIVDKEVLFFFKEDDLIPTLYALLKDVSLVPNVIVDKGAIKFVANGADIMRPGIVGCDSFSKGDFVAIVEETYKKPLAVGQADFSSEEILNMKEGKVISTVHFIGDSIWEMQKNH